MRIRKFVCIVVVAVLHAQPTASGQDIRISLQGGMNRNSDTDAACISVWISDSGWNARAIVHGHRLKGASFQSWNVCAVLGGHEQHGFR